MELTDILVNSGLNPNKNYYKIGELSKLLDVKTSVIRFWESEFNVKTLKNTANQRVYRKDDIIFFFKLHKLLYTDKYTIEGAKKVLLENNPILEEKSIVEKVIEVSKGSFPTEALTKIKRELNDIKNMCATD
ncbi:MAG: MerR family transcriptional regulator [Pseudomonadota bacterium]